MNFSDWLNPFLSPPDSPSWRLAPFPGGADSYGESYRYDEVWPWPTEALEAQSEAVGRSGGVLLDLGGGTGNVARAMVKRGHRVTLVDRSERMLASAREKKAALTPEEQSRFAIEKADLATLERSDTFPCIFAVGCPTTFLESEGEILRFLRKVHGWLEPGGYFYLDFFSLRHWEAFPGWKAAKWQPWFEKQTTKGPVRAWVKTYSEAEADRVVFEYSMSTRRWPIRFFHDLDRVCLFPEAKWREFLSSSGFTVHKQFGIWEHESYPDELPIGNDINLITLKAQRAS